MQLHAHTDRAGARALAFTPYPFEDVGALIRESSPELYLFSSEYPHTEGAATRSEGSKPASVICQSRPVG